MRREPAW